VFGENPCIYDTIGMKHKALLHTHTHTVVHNYFTTIQVHIGTEQRDFFTADFPMYKLPFKDTYSVIIAFSTAASNWRS
jgi:hypothetical protein